MAVGRVRALKNFSVGVAQLLSGSSSRQERSVSYMQNGKSRARRASISECIIPVHPIWPSEFQPSFIHLTTQDFLLSLLFIHDDGMRQILPRSSSTPLGSRGKFQPYSHEDTSHYLWCVLGIPLTVPGHSVRWTAPRNVPPVGWGSIPNHNASKGIVNLGTWPCRGYCSNLEVEYMASNHCRPTVFDTVRFWYVVSSV